MQTPCAQCISAAARGGSLLASSCHLRLRLPRLAMRMSTGSHWQPPGANAALTPAAPGPFLFVGFSPNHMHAQLR